MMILSNIIHNWCNWYQCHCFRLPNNIILFGASTECCINTGHNLNCNNSNTRMFWTLISSSLQNVQLQNQIAATNQRLSFSILWLIFKKANSIIVDYACKWRIIDSLMEWNNPEVVRPIEILFIWILSSQLLKLFKTQISSDPGILAAIKSAAAGAVEN